MAEHGALGAARGAGRVEDRGQIVRPARDVLKNLWRGAGSLQQRAVFAHAQSLDVRDPGDGGDGLQLFAILRLAHEDARSRIAQKIFDFGGRIGRVQRQKHSPCAQARQIEQDRVGRFIDLHRHAVASDHAAISQHIGDSGRTCSQIAVRDLAALRRLDENLAR